MKHEEKDSLMKIGVVLEGTDKRRERWMHRMRLGGHEEGEG